MSDNNLQEPKPVMQPGNRRIHVDPSVRQKVLEKIIATMTRSFKQLEMISQIEQVARKFEEKVFAEASDMKDYLKRISVRMSQLEEKTQSGAANSSMRGTTSCVPNPLHSASGDVQSQEPKYSQPPLQTVSSAQFQPHQIIPRNTPSSTGFCSVSSSTAAINSKLIQASGSNSTCQSSSRSNISGMPPNIKRNSSEHCIPSNPVVLSRAQEDKRNNLQQLVCSDYEKEILEAQQAQSQLPNRSTTCRDMALNMKKNPIQQAQPHPDQLKHVQLPNTQQTIKAAAFDQPAMQSSLSSAQLHNEGSSVKHFEKSVSHVPQPVAMQQHRSVLDVSHQGKLTAVQQKSIGQQSSSSINRQNHSPLGRLRTPSQQPRQELHSMRVQNKQQHQQVNHRNQQYITAPPERPVAQNVSHHGQGNQQQQAAPLAANGHSLGGQKASFGLPLSQWEETRKKLISQPQLQVIMQEKKPSPLMSSESQNVQTPLAGITEPDAASFEALNSSEVSSYVEKHDVGEAWREKLYRRILAMKSRYMSKVREFHYIINVKIKQLSLQPEQPGGQLEKFKEISKMLERILRLLNIPKEKLVPEHEESVDVWEKQIVNYLTKLSKPKNAASSLRQRLDPRHESLQESRPHEVVESSGLQEKDLTNQQGTVKTELLDLSQTDNCHAPPLPAPIHQSEKAQQLAPRPLVISAGISPSLLLSECQNNNSIPWVNSEIISDKTSIKLNSIQRLINSVSSISHCALESSVDDIWSVMNMVDGMEATEPRVGAKSAVGQDLAKTTLCRFQTTNLSQQDGSSCTGETKSWECPISIEMWNDSEKSNCEPTNEHHRKRPRIEAPRTLWEEIKDVNQRLVDTQVNICEEDIDVASVSEEKSGTGTVVKCCFNGVSVNRSFLKSLGCSGHLSTIEPLHLLVPTDYPKCSPVLLDKLPGEIGEELFHLSNKARSKFKTFLRSFEDPITISEIARTWEACAHAVLTEHAEKCGGGSFSSKYGKWENCLGTA